MSRFESGETFLKHLKESLAITGVCHSTVEGYRQMITNRQAFGYISIETMIKAEDMIDEWIKESQR